MIPKWAEKNDCQEQQKSTNLKKIIFLEFFFYCWIKLVLSNLYAILDDGSNPPGYAVSRAVRYSNWCVHILQLVFHQFPTVFNWILAWGSFAGQFITSKSYSSSKNFIIFYAWHRPVLEEVLSPNQITPWQDDCNHVHASRYHDVVPHPQPPHSHMRAPPPPASPAPATIT